MDINEFRISLGKRIREARLYCGYNQDDFGEWIERKKGAVSKYENGVGDIDTGALLIIAQRADTTVEWLITGKGPGPGEKGTHVNEAPQEYFTGGKGPSDIGSAILRAVIEGVEEYLEAESLELRPSKKADLIITLYEMCMEEGKDVDKATIVRLVRLAA